MTHTARLTSLCQTRASNGDYGLLVATGGHSEDLAYYGDASIPVAAYESLTGSYPFRAHLLVHHEAVDSWSALDKSIGPYLEYGAMKILLTARSAAEPLY